MNLKSVLTVLDAEDRDGAGLSGAIAVATAHGAHLIGLHVVDIPSYPTYVYAQLPSEVIRVQREHFLEIAEEARGRFESACAAAGVDSEWRCEEGPLEATVNTHARYADLVVVTGPAKDSGAAAPPALAEELVFSAGRPVLVVPPGVAAKRVGEYAVIAWDGGREAARTVSDAMALLAQAKQVSVVVVHTSATEQALGELPGADLSHFLARHGVKAEAQAIEAGEHSTGEALLEWTKGQGADLLVMGAYGHSRFREVLLGGTTRHVLTHAHVPVLMSH